MATDTKSQILAAAIELFALNGYEKTTMRKIAEKVGIQSASIYYFFGSKESLLNTIFEEFELNFAHYRNPTAEILKAAEAKPLSEVLSMMFYTFGSPTERDRMIAISRVILSLKYENDDAQRLIDKVLIKAAVDYGVEVLRALHSLGKIKESDFLWTAFTFQSFAVALFEENLRHLKPYVEGKTEYEDGIRFICSTFAEILEPSKEVVCLKRIGSECSSKLDIIT